jgi:hypothetical protein
MGACCGKPTVDELATLRAMEVRVVALGGHLDDASQVLAIIAGGVKSANNRQMPGDLRRRELSALTYRMLSLYGSAEMQATWPTPSAIESTVQTVFDLTAGLGCDTLFLRRSLEKHETPARPVIAVAISPDVRPNPAASGEVQADVQV